MSSVLSARRNLQIWAVHRDPLVVRKKRKREDKGNMLPKWGPCIRDPAIVTMGLACLPWGSRSWSYVTPSLGTTWIFRERKGKTQRAHHLLLLHCTSGMGSRWKLELKRAHCSLRHVLMCSMIPFRSLPNSSLSQTWEWTKKNQS